MQDMPGASGEGTKEDRPVAAEDHSDTKDVTEAQECPVQP
jgi:hypothetical protein